MDEKRHLQSNTVRAINRAVIRDNSGTLRVRQCVGHISNEQGISQHVNAFNNETVGDILNRLRYKDAIRKIIRGV